MSAIKLFDHYLINGQFFDQTECDFLFPNIKVSEPSDDVARAIMYSIIHGTNAELVVEWATENDLK